MNDFIYLSDLFGTIVFAISGALAAGRLRMDPFGVLVLAGVTAVGGGTVRDAVLGATPVFWITDTTYVWLICLTAAAMMLLVRCPRKLSGRWFQVADAFGLAVFTVIGAQKALSYGAEPVIAVMMGTMTGVLGGLIRDVLCREVPLVLRTEIYATACIVGGIVYTGCLSLELAQIPAMVLAMIATLTLRLVAIFYHLSLPAFALDSDNKR
ncbi:trimeric intracellular cation channel family protein [Ferrimonas lipolytica]|uniref:Trimeric intracellular cation channel family protein n=1 Tax=Ferrimonas lipolytica TaxID=2724191 RepID=A0A6H1UI30_9GAMM|nr:trimeric intracellular cation channel family protein [Ferrimonas lipolytica]QIZ78741.1 trimeric intracellular cation channel family protein [Ferrimonas lipolytica]